VHEFRSVKTGRRKRSRNSLSSISGERRFAALQTIKHDNYLTNESVKNNTVHIEQFSTLSFKTRNLKAVAVEIPGFPLKKFVAYK